MRRQSVLNFLRKFPFIYKGLKFARRTGIDLALNLVRFLAPVNSLFGAPKGFYSELDLVKQGKIPGRIIVPAQVSIQLAPDSLRKKCGLGQDGFQPWPIFWSQHQNVRLVGSTLLALNERKEASVEAMYQEFCHKDDPGYRYFKLPPATRLNGNWTSIISRWTVVKNYCHWFLDALPRLALLDEFPKDSKIIVPPDLLPFQLDSLKFLGLQDRVRPTSERHLIVENYFFSSPTVMTGCYDPYTATFLREKFLPIADKSYASPKRFYVRRVGANRGIVNEQEIIDELSSRGWAIVDCAQLTFAQQVKLFYDADEICALHGAALTNLLWCKPGCKAYELVAGNYQNGVFEGIAQTVGVNHRHLINEADSGFRARVDIQEFRKLLNN